MLWSLCWSHLKVHAVSWIWSLLVTKSQPKAQDFKKTMSLKNESRLSPRFVCRSCWVMTLTQYSGFTGFLDLVETVQSRTKNNRTGSWLLWHDWTGMIYKAALARTFPRLSLVIHLLPLVVFEIPHGIFNSPNLSPTTLHLFFCQHLTSLGISDKKMMSALSSSYFSSWLGGLLLNSSTCPDFCSLSEKKHLLVHSYGLAPSKLLWLYCDQEGRKRQLKRQEVAQSSEISICSL